MDVTCDTKKEIINNYSNWRNEFPINFANFKLPSIHLNIVKIKETK